MKVKKRARFYRPFRLLRGHQRQKLADKYVAMTEKDIAFEVDLDSTWQIYDGLKAVLEMAYLRLDYEDRLGGRVKAEEDIWNVQIILSIASRAHAGP